LIAQRVTPLESLPENEQEAEEERIALVMSSFFDVDEDETKEKDTADTTLVLKSTAPPAADETGPSSPRLEQVTTTVTSSTIMVAKDKGSSKPALVEDKGKVLLNLKRPRRQSKMIHRLVKDLSTKT
jgi:hypothetical protein